MAVVTGAYDVIAEIVARKGDGLHTHHWSLTLLGDAAALVAPQPAHDCEPGHLDELDEKIVDALRLDGRASFQAVAADLGVSESTVRRRYEALYNTGCVQVITLVPAAALGFEAEMFLWLSVAPSRLEAVAGELVAQRGVRYVAATLGQESLMCEVILPTRDDVYHFTTHVLGGIEGIQAWTANVEILTLKRGFVATPWTADLVPVAVRRQRSTGPAHRRTMASWAGIGWHGNLRAVLLW